MNQNWTFFAGLALAVVTGWPLAVWLVRTHRNTRTRMIVLRISTGAHGILLIATRAEAIPLSAILGGWVALGVTSFVMAIAPNPDHR